LAVSAISAGPTAIARNRSNNLRQASTIALVIM
jgi:hypothetical protein